MKQTWWEVFAEMWSKSVIVSGMIALLLTGVASYCVLDGRTIPPFFSMAFGVVIGYFFSEKTRNSTADSNADLVSRINNKNG